jgi:nucleoside-diphosphate-sugar epimerase
MSPHTPARRYLVTGGRGFIGRHLLARLAAQGAEVHATTRSATPPADPHVRWWRVDLADAVATEELVTRLRPDVVVHLAARADGTRRLDAVVPILTDTLLSTVSVLAAAARLPECKVVLAGSVEDGGHQPDVHSPYAASKAAAATYATLFHGLWQLDVTVLRLAMVYGPDDPNAHRLIPSVVAAFADGRRPAVSSGTRRIDWVYVEDVVDAFLAAADGEPGVFDIGSGTLVSIRATVRLVAAAMGTAIAPAFGVVGDRPLERELRADPEPARASLGWRPTVGLAEGIARTVAARTTPLLAAS